MRARNLPILVTLALFLLMFGAGSIAFTGFFSVQNFLNLFIDNAYLLILAVGMTFVIISGGIDLSVGSVLALSTMVSSSLLEKAHLSPVLVIPIVLAMGTALACSWATSSRPSICLPSSSPWPGCIWRAACVTW